MPFLDFLKKLFKEKEVEKIIEISLDNMPEKIKKEKENLEKVQENLENQTKDRTSSFLNQLKSRISLLETINIDKRKEQEKIKLIVKENFRLYLDYLKNLVYNLEKRQELKKISNYLLFFSKTSNPAFEKSTLLIGEELGQTRQLISSFAREINSLSEDNKKIEEKQKKIEEISLSMKKIEDSKNLSKDSEKNLESFNSKLLGLKEKKEKLEKEILDLKESKEYAALEQGKQQERQKLEQELLAVKKKIDFKELAKIFHTIEKKNKLIQEYNENFRTSLEQDKTLEIVEMVKSINLDISELKGLKDKMENLKTEKLEEIELIIKNSEDKINLISNEILDINSNIGEENKKIARLNEKISLLENTSLELGKSLI